MARILHSGDVHIRNYTRHEEYRHVFDLLYEKIKEIKPDRIVLNGDIFDSKTILSPESIKMTYDLLSELAKLTEVDVFVGNHDANLSNKSRLNSLHSIGHFLRENPKVHLYEKSGMYKIYDDVYYGVFSLLDGQENWPVHIENKDQNVCYVAIYHGAVNGSETYAKPIESDLEVDVFAEYDLVFLSDIHKRQFFKTYTTELEIDEKEIENYHHELGFEVV